MRFVLSAIGILCGVSLTAAIVTHDSAVEAGTARRMDVTAMVDNADLVVQGEVVTSRARVGARGLIETEHLLRITRTFWGDHLSQRTVTLPGGVLEDGRGLLLAGMPRLHRGEEVLLFLTRPSASGVRMPIGLAQGKFSVERLEDGTVRLARDLGGLQLANPATGEVKEAPARAIHGYAGLVAEIHAAVGARRSRVRVGEESSANGAEGE